MRSNLFIGAIYVHPHETREYLETVLQESLLQIEFIIKMTMDVYGNKDL